MTRIPITLHPLTRRGGALLPITTRLTQLNYANYTNGFSTSTSTTPKPNAQNNNTNNNDILIYTGPINNWLSKSITLSKLLPILFPVITYGGLHQFNSGMKLFLSEPSILAMAAATGSLPMAFVWLLSRTYTKSIHLNISNSNTKSIANHQLTVTKFNIISPSSDIKHTCTLQDLKMGTGSLNGVHFVDSKSGVKFIVDLPHFRRSFKNSQEYVDFIQSNS